MTASELATKTSDAYSFHSYRSWRACAKLLLGRGYTPVEAEAILRSKWMRWASDVSNYHPSTSKDLERFLDDPRNECTPEHVRGLVDGTY